jgi:hypothetical protein
MLQCKVHEHVLFSIGSIFMKREQHIVQKVKTMGLKDVVRGEELTCHANIWHCTHMFINIYT